TLKMLSTSPEDSPLGVQLLGNDADLLKRALDIVSAYNFDIVDFNAACPVSKVASGGKGAGLLREPEKLQELLKVIVEHSPVPVTVKIRTGWGGTSVNAVEVALRAQDAGVKALFIHGRTKIQGYSGTVDYNIIRKVKEAMKIPVIASGDALSPQLIGKLFEETGCDCVALARGALGNPWLFRETAEYLRTGNVPGRPDVHEIAQTMREHLAGSIAFKGAKTGIINFRKFFAWYTRGMHAKDLRSRAFVAETEEEMINLIGEVENSEVKIGCD
ncbi:MAG: tRNA-dihydrouridine synthase, partial [Nitrospirota bacterium]